VASIFTKIINREIPADIIYEDDAFIVFKDMYPKAPFHVLVVPKEEIVSLIDVKDDQWVIMGNMLKVAQLVAKQEGLNGYKLAMNVGKEGGQEVDHIHLHVMGDTSQIKNPNNK